MEKALLESQWGMALPEEKLWHIVDLGVFDIPATLC